MNPPRKPLTDQAKKFLKGEEVAEPSQPTITPASEPIKEPQKSSLLDKLTQPTEEGAKRFCVDLKISTHKRLTELSNKTGKPKTEIVRFLIEQALEELDNA